MRRQLVLGAAAIWAAVPVSAEAPFLSLPLACEIGRDCYIEDYVDTDPSDGVSDFSCGLKARDGHRGTDFALVTWDSYQSGVDVLAAAPGVVEATRDGIADQPYTGELAAKLKGRECGNAVRIRHENGMQTLYCHLRQGSVVVRPGDRVARGAPLGLVGMSGQSNYPHVHISVLGPDGHVDPFAPEAQSCGSGEEALWQTALPYFKAGMFTAAFSDDVPKFDDVKSGAARRAQISPDAPLVLYTHLFHAKDGDVITYRAEGPQGAVLDRAETLKTPKASQFLAYGRKAPQTGWPPGAYTGSATLTRDGRVLAVRFTEVTIR